ncbi:MAG: Uma2 family endonuclease [Fimbriimonadales bacterium]|nr:Uma2 family endonuclease [Fimbriimonadales bacterium]
MPIVYVEGKEVELLSPEQVLQLHAIAQLRKLLPLYEQTRDPELFAQIQHYDRYLPTEDGIPMENLWHRLQMYLLIELVYNFWRDRDDFLAGGNNFIYYSLQQAEEVVRGRMDTYRGPDFFLVTGIDPTKPREAWIVWEEDYKFPDLIVEFLSPSTEKADKETKWGIYRDVFRTREYFLYEPFKEGLTGYEWVEGEYVPKTPNERGWLWSEVLGAWLGTWEGEFYRHQFKWLRLYRADGALVLTTAEERELAQQEAARAQQEAARAQQEAARAQQEAAQERQRAEQAQAELERLKARLRELGLEE